MSQLEEQRARLKKILRDLVSPKVVNLNQYKMFKKLEHHVDGLLGLKEKK